MNLAEVLRAFIAFREEVIVRRTVFDLRKARDRAHVLAGLAIAVANIEDVIALIRAAKDPNEARTGLMERPWPAGDVVYVVSKAGELITINRENGQVYWITDLNAERTRQEGGVLGIGDRTVRPIWSGPLLATNRLILVNSDGQAVAVDR